MLFRSAHNGFNFAQGFDPRKKFSEYLEFLAAQERGECLPEGYVPMSVFCAFVGDEIVGRLSIRHALNDFLFNIGGHIGYAVVPEFRRKGYATAMLRSSLSYARELGIEKALVTCDDTNVGSFKTIAKCGGEFENLSSAGEGKVPKRRYWIATV